MRLRPSGLKRRDSATASFGALCEHSKEAREVAPFDEIRVARHFLIVTLQREQFIDAVEWRELVDARALDAEAGCIQPCRHFREGVARFVWMENLISEPRPLVRLVGPARPVELPVAVERRVFSLARDEVTEKLEERLAAVAVVEPQIHIFPPRGEALNLFESFARASCVMEHAHACHHVRWRVVDLEEIAHDERSEMCRLQMPGDRARTRDRFRGEIDASR
jgi:hypothetical protein